MAVVLVAEDEPAIRSLLALLLKSAGHEALTAANGVEAIALYRSTPDRIDLVITDIRMPVMDGCQVVNLIRETRPGARIVCMSGYAEKDLPAGVAFLPKPFVPKDLLAIVAASLGA